MRAPLVIVIALVAGCGKKATDAKPGQSLPPAIAIPRAESGVPLADARWPPAIVWVSATGALEVTVTHGTDKRELAGTRNPVADWRAVKEAIILGVAPSNQVDEGSAGSDDPPPPPEEDRVEPTDRPEGQVRMMREPDDPELARAQAIEKAREAGILAETGARGSAPGRLSLARAKPIHDLDLRAPIIAAAPEAPAVVVAQLVMRLGGMIAVSTNGAPAVMASGFSPEGEREREGATWLELVGGASGVTLVDAGAGKLTAVPWSNGALDREALGRLLGSDAANIDVLAGAGMTAQQLVDVLALLDHRQGTTFSLGETVVDPGQRLAQITSAQKAARIADEVRIGLPNAAGDLPKSVIRERVHGIVDKIRTCYDDARAKHPGISGTITTQFFITPNGDVASADAQGVDTALSSCVVGLLKALTFPKPRGGGVMVNYPVTFASPD